MPSWPRADRAGTVNSSFKLMKRHLVLPRRMARILAGASALTALAGQAHAQKPSAVSGVHRFDTGIVLGGSWDQATALPLDRNAMQSVSFDASLRRDSWFVDAGYLRIARDLSTVQGGYVGVGPQLHWKQLSFLPSVRGFVGQADASRDTTGYNYALPGGGTGHQARFSYSNGTSIGGGVALTVEAPIYRMFGVRAGVSQWYFSGKPLEGDRNRTVVAVGLSLRAWR